MDAKTDAAPAAAAAPAAPEKTEVTIKLRKPVIAHGETVNELTFREPTGADIMTLGGEGFPLLMNFVTGEVKLNNIPMSQMMSVLAAVPMSTIRMMKAKDWTTCAVALMGFFLPDEQAM